MSRAAACLERIEWLIDILSDEVERQLGLRIPREFVKTMIRELRDPCRLLALLRRYLCS